MAKVVIGGCSFSDPNFKSTIEPDHVSDYKKWFDYLDYSEIRSVGKSGWNNKFIIDKVIDEVILEDVDVAIIALTDWTRFNVLGLRFSSDIMLKYSLNDSWKSTVSSNLVEIAEKMVTRFDLTSYVTIDDLLNYCISDTMRSIVKLIEICKARGVELHLFQMIQPCMINRVKKDFNKKLIYHKYFDYLDNVEDVNIIGFPFTKHLGGIIVEDVIPEDGRISKIDAHPNELGHKEIGRFINEKIKNFKT